MSDTETTTLPKKFVIYVPTETGAAPQVCGAVENILCDRLGGVTSYPARGVFKMADSSRKTEKIQVLETYCEATDWVKQKPFLWSLAKILSAVLEQEAMAVAVDGRMELLDKSAADCPKSLEGRSVGECQTILESLVNKALAADEIGDG